MAVRNLIAREYFDKLFEELEGKNVTVGDIAEMLGLEKKAVFDYRSGRTVRIPLSRLEKIAMAYDLDFYDLVEYELDYERKRFAESGAY